MERSCLALFILVVIISSPIQAQVNSFLASDEYHILNVEEVDLNPMLNVYERFNKVLGGDSTRHCSEFPCTGWVEDNYADGSLKHRGYYDRGKLILYRNFHPNGDLEREFKSVDDRKSLLRTYYTNKVLRSETRFIGSKAVTYQDHYPNGQLRYHEEKHRTEAYYLRMDLYDANGAPISLLELVDKKKLEFLMREYHPGGKIREEGRARYNPGRMDTQRIGTWRTYDAEGVLEREEDHVDGKIVLVKTQNAPR